MLGCKQVMPHRFMDPARLIELMSSEKVTLSAGVPTIWQGVKGLYESNPALTPVVFVPLDLRRQFTPALFDSLVLGRTRR